MRGVCPSCAYQLLWFKGHPFFELGWIEVRIWIVKNGITQHVLVNPSVFVYVPQRNTPECYGLTIGGPSVHECNSVGTN